MSWVKKLLGLEKDLDVIAIEELQDLRNVLGTVGPSLTQIGSILENILRAKRTGRKINPKVRKHLIATLKSIEEHLLVAARMEKRIINEEEEARVIDLKGYKKKNPPESTREWAA